MMRNTLRHPVSAPAAHSCSTFLLAHGDDLLIGHNLDDYIPTRGLVIANPRQAAKENLSFQELFPEFYIGKPKQTIVKKRWVSQYGSLTYNTGGKEFIDGGLNEAGLYLGEMTLFSTAYPRSQTLPKFYHHQWMQYVLDTCATVDEALNTLNELVIDGHCLWHFFLADQSGKAAIVEFIEGKTLIYQEKSLPHPLLCNAAYEKELEALPQHAEFGGAAPLDFAEEKAELRFAQGAALLQAYRAGGAQAPLSAQEYALKILRQIRGDNNKWGILYDIRRFRLYFYTDKGPQLRWVDFSAFDFSGSQPAMVLDINRDLAGDTASHFTPFDPATNSDFILWNEVQVPGVMGLITRHLGFPAVMRRMTKWAVEFQPK